MPQSLGHIRPDRQPQAGFIPRLQGRQDHPVVGRRLPSLHPRIDRPHGRPQLQPDRLAHRQHRRGLGPEVERPVELQVGADVSDRIPPDRRVDYYVKGPVVGLVLDAHIRRHTNGRKSLDDAMRLAYARWSGARGYTGAEFNQTICDAAGFDVSPLLNKLIATTEEIDYAEMLDWFGLRFAGGDDPQKTWVMEVDPGATVDQKQHFAAFLAPSRAR